MSEKKNTVIAGLDLSRYTYYAIGTRAFYEDWLRMLKDQMPAGVHPHHLAIQGPLGRRGIVWRWLARLGVWILKHRGFVVVRHRGWSDER